MSPWPRCAWPECEQPVMALPDTDLPTLYCVTHRAAVVTQSKAVRRER